MNVNQIKKVRVYEQVIEQIKQSIESGQTSPGDKLPSEREMADLFNVSRSVIREAMSVLSASGLLDIRPGIGVFIVDDEQSFLIQRINRALKKVSVNLHELLEVRQGLECQAVYLASIRATTKDIDRIKEAYSSLEQAVLRGDLAASEDFAFHAAIIRASKNDTIMEIMRLLSDRLHAGLQESRSKSLKHPYRAKEVLTEHKGILDAILERNAEKARDLMLNHLENVKNSTKKS